MPLIDNPVLGQAMIGSEVRSLATANAMSGIATPYAMPTPDWVRLRQPYLDRRGRACVSHTDLDGRWTKNDGRGGEPKPLITNYLAADLLNRGYPIPLFTLNAATLTKEQWIQLDRQVVLPYRQRLQAAADLEAANSYGGFDAMGTMTLEYQAQSDPGEAVVDMDARTDARNDTPLYILRSLPLPITHSDFGFSSRELAVSRARGGRPLDTAMGEAAGRRVAESIEDQTLGIVTGVTYGTQTAGTGTHTGTSTVYGYSNFPQRLTKTNFTAPTAGGWTPETTYNELLAAVQQLINQRVYGPFNLYFSIDWFQYMNRNFSTAGGNNAGETTITMLQKIPNVAKVAQLDRLTSTFTLLLVSMNSDVAQMVNGMEVTTIQWEEKGGLELRFKVMAIKVPRLRSDYNSRSGILHGTTS